MMYHLDGRWRHQALVYFGEPQDLVVRAPDAQRCDETDQDHEDQDKGYDFNGFHQ